jgi:XapX domain-containing protein
MNDPTPARPKLKIAIGLVLGFGIGVLCRVAVIPAPAPPVLEGALLVVAMTVGYLVADWLARGRPHATKHLCGGPDSHTVHPSRPGDQT